MSSTRRRDVIVAGGGISGLVAAYRMKRAGLDVALVESGDSVGGCMQSEHRDGFILEKGPFNVLVRDDAFHDLLDDAAGDVEPVLASAEADARYVLKNGHLHLVPTGPGALVSSPLLSFGAKLRMLLGMLVSSRATTDEPTIAEVAERRLGAEVADTFISSIVAGIFGGDSRKLSLKACFPKAWQFDQERRSPLLYEMAVLKEKKRKLEAYPDRRARKGLISFAGGLQSLADWLAAQAGDDLHVGCRVDSIQRDTDGYSIRTVSAGETREFACRHLVLATPSNVAADLVRPHVPQAARELDAIECASLVVLNLAFRRDDVGHPMQGYGFLVPQSASDMPVMGVLWADSAFPHHAPRDQRLIRVFMGGPRDAHAAERSDDDLLAAARGAIDGLLAVSGDPTLIDICRWPASIPQYHVGHTDRITRLEHALQMMPGLHLAGSYLRGVSINDCVRNAADLGDEIAAVLAQPATSASDAGDRRHEAPGSGPANADTSASV